MVPEAEAYLIISASVGVPGPRLDPSFTSLKIPYTNTLSLAREDESTYEATRRCLSLAFPVLLS